MNGLENVKVGDDVVCISCGMWDGMIASSLKVAKVSKLKLFLTKDGLESENCQVIKIADGKSVNADKWSLNYWYAAAEPAAIEAINKTRKAKALSRMKKEIEEILNVSEDVDMLREKLAELLAQGKSS